MITEKEKYLFEEVEKRNPNLEPINTIINDGVNINVRNENGETLLMNAINYINNIKWYDENGNLAETGDESIELVQSTVPKIDISIIEYLLEMGVDPNIEDNDGTRCLKEAVWTFRSDVFKLLLEYNAEINFKVYGEESFCDWILYELNEFKYDGNRIAADEISKMVEMINEYK